MAGVSLTEGITDENLQQVYSDPYILKVGHDHRPASPVIHPAVTYLSAWVENQFAGAFLAIRFSPLEIEVHSLLFKAFVRYSRLLGKSFFAWAFSHPEVTRVTAYIIDGLNKAFNYCMKLDMEFEGTRHDACLKNGYLTDIHILGMTRSKWVTL